jgi:signal transduction histidine kinase
MHQGTVRRSDPGQAAAQSKDASPVALTRLAEPLGSPARSAELERELQQLRQRCEELDGFAHAVAHDLRSPLSAIDGFSTLLEESLRDLPQDQVSQARHWASRVRTAAQQMGELIEGLQALAQLSRSPMKMAAVNLSELAEQVLAQMAQRHPSPLIEAVVQPGLRAVGDRRLLRQLLENLIDNARKFSARCPRVQIEFGRLSQPDGSQAPVGAYFVADHGAGFDMAQAARLFQPYERLHGQEEFAGLGLGLAIVRRIASRHGGRVWAQSQLAQGTRVYFTLDAAADAPPSAHQGA